MNILQITNKIPIPARDGGSIATFRLSKALVELGHESDILAMNTSKHYIDKEYWEPIANQVGIHLIPVKINTRIKPIEALLNLLFSSKPYNAVRFSSVDFKKELQRMLTTRSYDLIIIENLYPFLYLKTIRKLSRAKIVMRAHNVEHEIWTRTAANSKGLEKTYLSILARRIRHFELKYLNTYDFLIPITERDREAFNLLGNRQPSMALPTGIITEKVYPDIKLDRILEVAHLGALDWAPNQEGILWFLEKVWPLILKEQPDARFQLAGRNAPSWFVKKLKPFQIDFHGEVKSAADFIEQFPIHIVPLWSGSGMRIKIVEAMARARVIVTTPVGVEGINAVDGKHLLIRDQADHFAEAILNLMNHPELVHTISKNAFTFVQNNFENTRLVDGFVRFVKEHDGAI